MLRILYNMFRQRFWDLLIEDFYSKIPKDLKEPALDFLANGKDKLEKAWSVQAYRMQRRSILDPKNAEVYKGILILLRAQLLALEKTSKVRFEPIEKEEKIEDPSIAVEDFVKKGKERFTRK